MNDVSGVEAGVLELNLGATGDGIDIEVDGFDRALSRAVGVEDSETLVGLKGG
jgi:hypothetical protein